MNRLNAAVRSLATLGLSAYASGDRKTCDWFITRMDQYARIAKAIRRP